MRCYLIVLSLVLILFSACKKENQPNKPISTEAEPLFNRGELLLDDSTLLMTRTCRFEKDIDTNDRLNDKFHLYFDAGLAITIHNSKDSNTFVGDYSFSKTISSGVISSATVFTDNWDIPNSFIQYGDYDMLNGKLTIDSASTRYLEYPSNAPGDWQSRYYQYYQEVDVYFYGILNEKDYTLNYGNEKIDTIFISGMYQGFIAYHDEYVYTTQE